MDEKCGNWLRQSFFSAFPGNQKQMFQHLRGHYNLEFRGRSYQDAWEELAFVYGEDRLSSTVKGETTRRLISQHLDEMRTLFWGDETPLLDTLKRLDPTNWRAWVETVSGMIDQEWAEWVVQWSSLANLWFQCLDASPPSVVPPPPQPHHGAFTVGIDDPEPLFKKWLEWKGARVTSVLGLPVNFLTGTAGKTMYILKYWSGALPPGTPVSRDFLQELFDVMNRTRSGLLEKSMKIIPIACSLTGFSPEAATTAQENGVELWGGTEIIANWMQAGAIGIAYESGHWYIVWSPSNKARAHLTPKRRVRYS